MKITINKKEFIVSDGATLESALAEADIKTIGTATAVNGKVIPKADRTTLSLSDGDSIVIIKAFYGG